MIPEKICVWKFNQIIEEPCVHSRGHNFDPKCMLLCRMVILIKSRSGSKLGHVASKSRSLVQMIENLLYTIKSIVQETMSEC